MQKILDLKKGVQIWRNPQGIPHVQADNINDMYWGQGFVHAVDRGMQMLLMRILGQGRAAELLQDDEETLKIDIFFRRMNWAGNSQKQLDLLDHKTKQILDSYCQGINAVLSQKYPWEFKLLGYRPEEWRPQDTLTTSRMMSYLTLAQSQAEMERLFVEMVQAGVSQAQLEELFPGLLQGLDLELLHKVNLQERIVPPEVLWNNAVPRMMASNNWVVAGSKTASGSPILANDPHLESNRLPNIWCEVMLMAESRYLTGGSIPGIPGIMTGRNSDLAWSVTYAFLDSIDSWVEKCEQGKYFRKESPQWHAFDQRLESIKRKKSEPREVIFYENEHGVLDGDPHQEGYYLATRWAASESGAVSLNSALAMWEAQTVDDGMNILGKIETGWNFVFADTQGSIGFQMSGLVPKRRKGLSGFIPLPGWIKANDWQGFYTHEEMPRIKNPPEGYFATANQNLNQYGVADPINMPMGPYRADRISALLRAGKNFSITDMSKMHFDVYSRQAQSFMKILKPLLPDTLQGRILQDWNLEYEGPSQGAFLFEEFYQELYQQVFGKNGFGTQVIKYLKEDTGTFIDFYENFDRILLSEKSAWFKGQTREELFRRTAVMALQVKPRPWQETRQFMLTNILFNGKLPAMLGFDRGPVAAIGGRATIHQGQIYRSAGRETTFMPSMRTITDMTNDDFFSVIAGGPSDRRFSKWYCSDLQNWITGKYKKLTPACHDQEKVEFKQPNLRGLWAWVKKIIK